ncbi:MAG: bacteriohemerythrin [Desulfovibrio sp.]|jgi:hemerythrin-like metal-binding protein|nr:bacteriohemerythrin [Desulfovibrio sp.]
MTPLCIKWTDKFNIGVTMLDEQHRGLVSIINSFYYHKSDAVVERFLAPTADTLFAFCRIHFMTEEAMMEEAEYPELEDHRKVHRDTFSTLEKLRYECSRDKDPDRFMQFLKDYWNQHVNDYDRRYVKTLHEYFDL